MPLTLRQDKGSALTISEMDGNFTYLSSSIATSSPVSASYATTSSYSTTATQLDGVQTTIVNIPSASILTMGSSYIELLPSPGVGKYYDINKVIVEYTHVTTAYTLTDSIFVGNNNEDPLSFTFANLITSSENRCWVINGEQATGDDYPDTSYNASSNRPINNEAVVIGTWNTTNPTLGDGTMRVIITYTTRTFGA